MSQATSVADPMPRVWPAIGHGLDLRSSREALGCRLSQELLRALHQLADQLGLLLELEDGVGADA